MLRRLSDRQRAVFSNAADVTEGASRVQGAAEPASSAGFATRSATPEP